MVKDDEQKILSLNKKEKKKKVTKASHNRNNLFWKFFNKKKKTKYNETNTLIYFPPSLRDSLVGIANILGGEKIFVRIIF